MSEGREGTMGDRMPTVEVWSSRLSRPSQRWRWRRTAGNGRILAVSSEGYRDRTHALAMALQCNRGPYRLAVGGHWWTIDRAANDDDLAAYVRAVSDELGRAAGGAA